MVYELNQDKKLQIIFPDYYEVNKEGKILRSIRRHDFEKVGLLDQPAHGACTMFRTKTLYPRADMMSFLIVKME